MMMYDPWADCNSLPQLLLIFMEQDYNTNKDEAEFLIMRSSKQHD